VEKVRRVELDHKCIALLDHGLTSPKDLSNCVCYKDSGGGVFGMKVDSKVCDVCPSLKDVSGDFEDPE
jgi:hypothetical protein